MWEKKTELKKNRKRERVWEREREGGRETKRLNNKETLSRDRNSKKKRKKKGNIIFWRGKTRKIPKKYIPSIFIKMEWAPDRDSILIPRYSDMTDSPAQISDIQNE